MDSGNGKSGKIAIIVQYDGTKFNGWQYQNEGRTVQQEIENALKILTGELCAVVSSGRTDSGVHAIGQVAHFNLKSDISLQKLCIGLNGILPRDISVKNAFRVEDDFHSRYSAVEREYRYLIYNFPLRTPFMRYRAMWVNYNVDMGYVKEAASYLIGEHDFASFCKKRSSDINTVRKISSIDISFIDNVYCVTFKGNAFLHNMIRIIIGTIMDMAKDGKGPEYINEILNKRDRNCSGKTAPPYGLYLARVYFDPELETRESAF